MRDFVFSKVKNKKFRLPFAERIIALEKKNRETAKRLYPKCKNSEKK